MSNSEARECPESIAIVGMSGRFPGAKNVTEFWQNLRNGVESISSFSPEELKSAGVDPAILNNPDYVNAAGILEDIELFDAGFFGFSARDAEVMDPQQRLFLECAWESLENAGYNPETYPGLIGVFAGAAMSTYLFHLYWNSERLRSVDHFQILFGNDKDYLATQVSYKLNLRGPSLSVQTACSTSLVAVCMACQSLLAYQCDMALAGGVAVNVPQKRGYLYQRGGIKSPDGHCRAFDAAAQGTVGSNGLGIVVLKRLTDALAEGDCIHAIIRGTAVNNDGSFKVGFTAPSVAGQAEVIAMAQAEAAVEPETITYIEAHGTGTPLGDPIEVAALTQVFQASSSKTGFCAIGSVKTNIGHLDPAAGIAGLIKTVLALEHKLLPPSLLFREANPQINFASSPFYVNTKLSEWKAGRTPRRAGVSSFGIGGTNAHVVIEQAPEPPISASSRPWQLLVLSAKTHSALETATSSLVEYLKHSNLNLADVAYTTQVGRKAFSHRRMVVCRNRDDALDALETHHPRRVLTLHEEGKHRPVVFLFPGQGTQYVHMAHELYQLEPVFREQVDLCGELLRPYLELDLRQVLFPSAGYVEQAAQRLKQTALAQPTLFVIEYALARLWMEWGIYPQAMIGHSLGEFVAACLAGVFSLDEALKIVAVRGQLMEQLPSGAMTAVPLSEQQAQPFCDGTLSIASVNTPSLCVISGPTSGVDRLETQLAERGINYSRLHTSHAFHSKMMEPILEAFTENVRTIHLNAPQIPYMSNVTGTWVTEEQATNPRYWATHLRQTVRFAEGMEELVKYPDSILLEVGPGQTLSTLARQHPKKAIDQVVLSSLPPAQDRQSDIALLLNSLGRLWLCGVLVNWAGFHARERRCRVPLPTYPFERERYWIEPQQASSPRNRVAWLTKKKDIADWFYVPTWKLAPPLTLLGRRAPTALPSRWLVFSDECGLGPQLVRQLEGEGREVITVRAGDHFAHGSPRVYTISPQQPDHYRSLLKELVGSDKYPEIVAHLWSVTPCDQTPPGIESVEQFQDLGFYSLLFLAQALGEQNGTTPVKIGVVSNQMQAVTGNEILCPAKATVLGPCKVIPQEYPNITCRSIDIILAEAHGSEARLVDNLIAELTSEEPEPIVAYRANRRCVQGYQAISLAEAVRGNTRLRKGGVYLITGGLGGIGLALAEDLARTVQANLVLTGRIALPERDRWEQWLATHGSEDVQSRKIRRVQDLERVGSQVMVATGDVADQKQMQQVIQQALARFGEIHGVIHCAGVAGGGMIQLKRRGVAASVLAAKVNGVLILNDLFKNTPLDFFVVCSSLASILGGFGQVDYCAANAFLDAFAHCHTREGRFTLSIDWDTWQEVGMAVATTAPGEFEKWRKEILRNGILPSEGVDAFSRALGTSLPQVAISSKDLQTMIESVNLPVALESREESQQPSLPKPRHSRPVLATPYEAARNEVERVMAGIWQELLGIERVGIHDNFFELGGHSLLAIQLNSCLRDAFKVEISVRQVFDAPTVAELASCVEKATHDLERITKLLDQIEHLSQDEVRSLLSEQASSAQRQP